MTRVWINQPSTLQPDHCYHGRNGLVNFAEKRHSSKGDIVRFWFADGEEVSTDVFASSLSGGFNSYGKPREMQLQHTGLQDMQSEVVDASEELF